MLYFFRLLCLLININQETVLNWLGIEDPRVRNLPPLEYGFGIEISGLEPSPDVSLETFRIILDALKIQLQGGLWLQDIENILFFIAFIRFIILGIRYNIQTSFLITCIGIIAGYVWYVHFIDEAKLYEQMLFRVPFTYKLGKSIRSLRLITEMNEQSDSYHLKWLFPIQCIMKGIKQGSWNKGYLIDPISMLFSIIPEPVKSVTDQIYYTIYRDIVPQVFRSIRYFHRELGAMAFYTIIVRMGKPYCPYLIRWHWTYLLTASYPERFVHDLVERVDKYIGLTLTAQFYDEQLTPGQSIAVSNEMFLLNWLVIGIMISHLSLILFALLHALCGQYFYMPILTETTELHVGPRPKTIYSGGYTAWQDRDKTDLRRLIPWYGWFGRGVKNDWQIQILSKLKKFLKKIFKKLKKRFKK